MKKNKGRYIAETEQERKKLQMMRYHQRKARAIRKILLTKQEVL